MNAKPEEGTLRFSSFASHRSTTGLPRKGVITLALNVTILAPCEWCEQYDLDEPLVLLEHGRLNLCVMCYDQDYCEACQLCDTLLEPDEIDERVVAVVDEIPGFPQPVPAGVYDVLGSSASSQLLVGQGWLWPNRLRLLTPLTPVDDDPPPCGYLCERCRLDARHGGVDLPGEVT